MKITVVFLWRTKMPKCPPLRIRVSKCRKSCKKIRDCFRVSRHGVQKGHKCPPHAIFGKYPAKNHSTAPGHLVKAFEKCFVFLGVFATGVGEIPGSFGESAGKSCIHCGIAQKPQKQSSGFDDFAQFFKKCLTNCKKWLIPAAHSGIVQYKVWAMAPVPLPDSFRHFFFEGPALIIW